MPRAGTLLLLLVLLAGCTAEPPPAATSSPAPNTSAPPVTSAPPAEPPAATPATPTAEEPRREPFAGSWGHRHAEGELVVRFDVPQDAAPADVSIAILPTLAAPQCDADASVAVASPVGLLLEAHAGEGGGCGTMAAKRNETLHPGTWTIWFNGTGEVTSMVLVGGGNASAARPFSFEAEHDFSEAAEDAPFLVPRDLEADIELSFEPSLGTSCVPAPEIAIEVLGPDGAAVARHALSPLAGGVCGAALTERGLALETGAWSVRFSGTGSARGIARLVASG